MEGIINCQREFGAYVEKGHSLQPYIGIGKLVKEFLNVLHKMTGDKSF